LTTGLDAAALGRPLSIATVAYRCWVTCRLPVASPGGVVQAQLIEVVERHASGDRSFFSALSATVRRGAFCKTCLRSCVRCFCLKGVAAAAEQVATGFISSLFAPSGSARRPSGSLAAPLQRPLGLAEVDGHTAGPDDEQQEYLAPRRLRTVLSYTDSYLPKRFTVQSSPWRGGCAATCVTRAYRRAPVVASWSIGRCRIELLERAAHPKPTATAVERGFCQVAFICSPPHPHVEPPCKIDPPPASMMPRP